MVVSDRLTTEQIKQDHACSCPACDPSVLTPMAPWKRDHFSVEDPCLRPLSYCAYLEGERVEGSFYAIVGERGRVWRYRGVPSPANTNRHICKTCHPGQDRDWTRPMNACSEVLEGRIEIRITGLNPHLDRDGE